MAEYADLIGRPFKYGGRPPGRELDCYGLVMEYSCRLGVQLPSRQFSEQTNVIATLMSMQMSEWKPCEIAQGAVLLFRVMRVPQHVGVAVSPFEFIHTWEGSGGVVKERLDDWQHRLVGAYRYEG